MEIENILFRADSSSSIGTGHIMRDLVLAEQLQDDNIIFATQDLLGNINHKIEEKKYTIDILRSNALAELDSLIKKLKIDMIVIDHYSIDYNFEKQLKDNNPALIIMSLDDTYEQHYCDILLNHNIYADSSKYKDLVPKHCVLRCGVKYTLLRDEFLSTDSIKVEKRATNRIFIAMGGADSKEMNIPVLDNMKALDVKIDVVTTSANQYLSKLQKYTESKENITLHIDSKDLVKIIERCNMAIVTPSVIVNEIIFLQTPFISILVTENQIYMDEYLKENGFICINRSDIKDLSQHVISLYDTNTYAKQINTISKIIQQRITK